MQSPSSTLAADIIPWGAGKTLFRVHRSVYSALQFNSSASGSARFSPLRNAAGVMIPTLYAGSTIDCTLMETVFHDVPFVAGPKMVSKASHLAGMVYSQLTVTRALNLIELSPISLRKLGIPRKELIESDGSRYPETRAWAAALHEQNTQAEGLLWTSRQAAPAEAIVLFGDRFEHRFEGRLLPPPITLASRATSLLLGDSSAITPVLELAVRMDVLLTP